MSAARCRSCSRELGASAKYCGNCGHPTARERGAARRRDTTVHRELVRAGGVLALGFVGVLVACCLGDESEWLQALTEAGVVALCFAVLGTNERSSGLLDVGSWRAHGMAVATALVGIAISWGYARLVNHLLDPVTTQPIAAPLGARLFWFALVPGLLEELLCRGALYTAARTLAFGRGAILVTAIVFAFLHGLNGLWLLELPHRFVLGLLLGVLRERSGSVWPCVVAHTLHNGIAVVFLAD